jgi:hypothetical protein
MPWWYRGCPWRTRLKAHRDWLERAEFAVAGGLQACREDVVRYVLSMTPGTGLRLALNAVCIVLGSDWTTTAGVHFALQWFRRQHGLTLAHATAMVSTCWLDRASEVCSFLCPMLTQEDAAALGVHVLRMAVDACYWSDLSSLMRHMPPEQPLPEDLLLKLATLLASDEGDFVVHMLQHAVRHNTLSDDTSRVLHDRWPGLMQQCNLWSSARCAWICASYRASHSTRGWGLCP